MRRRFTLRPSPAMFVAFIALLLALGSSAFAAGAMVSNSDRVDGFHASTKPKPMKLLALNKSGKFPASVLTFNRGPTGRAGAKGDTGATGPAGVKGDTGAQGAIGPSDALAVCGACCIPVPPGGNATPVALGATLPDAGSYVLEGRVNVSVESTVTTPTSIECEIDVPSAAVNSASNFTYLANASGYTMTASLPLVGFATGVPAGATVNVMCTNHSSTTTVSALGAEANAIKVGTMHH